MLKRFDRATFKVLNNGVQRFWSILRPPWAAAQLQMLFVIALALPLIPLVVWEGYRVADEAQMEMRKQYMVIVEGLGDDVDELLQNYVSMLQTLSLSSALTNGDNAATTYEQARTILERQGLYAFLSDPSGKQLFDTRKPFGSSLSSTLALIKPVLTTKQYYVSDLAIDDITKRPIIFVNVPILKGNELDYVFSLAVDIDVFQRIFNRYSQFPLGLTIVFADRKGAIIARHPQSDNSLTSIPMGEVANYIDTTGRAEDLEGYPVLFARKISRLAGWSILDFAPASTANAKIFQGLLGYVAMIGLVTIFGLIGAVYLGRLIVAPLHQLQRAAEALGKGEEFSFPRCFLKEARSVEEALTQSAAQRKETEEKLLQTTERFLAAEEGAGGFVYDWDVPADRIWRSEGFTRLVGWGRDEIPPTSEGWRQLLGSNDYTDRLNNEEGTIDGSGRYGLEVEVRHRDGHYLWVWDRGRVFRDASGEIVRRVGSKIDITPRKALEFELAHRYKNLLAVTQSIAKQTLKNSPSLAHAEEALSERLESLARTYSTLTQAGFLSVPIAKIVSDELSAFSSRANIQGPPFFLQPKAAQTLALIVHELATNAAKYGALSVPNGIVRVRWGTEASLNEEFYFSWRERGGPPVKVPSRRGFGTILTEEMATIQFCGTISREFQKDGFSYDLTAPISEVSAAV